MKTKICTKCKKELPHSKFSLRKNGTNRVHRAWCVDCVKDNELFKTCNICNEKLPKTKEYFNIKIIKQQNQGGIATYYSFRHACRKCLNEKIAKYKREQYKDPKVKEKETQRHRIYVNENREKVRDCNVEWRRKNRQSVLEKDRKRVRELGDSWIASSIGIPLKECPKELIETKKNLIRLKRELGLTHSTIAERNINNKYKKQWKQKEI